MESLIQKIITTYGLTAAQVHPVQKGYRNSSWRVTLTDGRDVNLIIYKREPGILGKIQSAHAVSELLARQRFPVRHAIDERIMRLQGTGGVRYAGLYNYLPGTTIPWEGYTKKHIKLLGKVMSDMHYVLAFSSPPVKGDLGGFVVYEYFNITHRMRTYFSDPHVQAALKEKLDVTIPLPLFDRYEKVLRATQKLHHQQPLHMDFVRGNILFTNTKPPKSPFTGGLKCAKGLCISGILDFEKAGVGHPVLDIARTLAFLLVDCKYTPEEKVRKYFLYSGYHKRGAAKLPCGKERILLEELVHFFLLYDFYKFLRHNPYESLAENEHYLRTRELLECSQFN